ncbi:ATP-binding protein [Candidatus Thiothrix sp. Deng01]|uniref:ATP-binding protein n=1 Tax=Candidatus Thiothrix phosphatis TaxID=3112415 RepID=A0ABU6D2E0_9GAMM|nr:ATP-binding protein [Candidatus Thiothrix sp. Deng01]MEB4592522.1 ATP-binding protein [Candidatus Thiothrix sp. Deng01]
MFTERHLTPRLLTALNGSPIVFISGARQAGKSTLAQILAAKDYPADYVTFDSPTAMAAAVSNPDFFLRRERPLIIDEVQLVPGIFRALKKRIDDLRLADNDSSYGRYLLTGSANIMALPKLADALVGRMALLRLYPLSALEVHGREGVFLANLFNNQFPGHALASDVEATLATIHAATFPELPGKDAAQRELWFDSYITTLLQRDVRQIAEVEKITLLPSLLRLMASRAGQLVNDSEIARSVGLNAVTGKRYRTLLEFMYLTTDIPPWFRNIEKRLVKAPKAYLLDSNLLCHTLGYRLHDLPLQNPTLFGHVLENFVASELIKQLSFSDTRASLFHFRTSDGKEVDFVLERPNGQLAGVEVKAAGQVQGSDFKGLRELQQQVGDDFRCGVVLYQGSEIVPFGERLWAMPLAVLWH